MERYKEHLQSKVCFRALALVIFWAFAAAPLAAAQFRLPKLPKLPKTGEKKSEPSKAAAPEAPEILSLTPNSFPPGGSGEVVLAGKAFFRGMRIRVGCKGDSEEVNSLKDHAVRVESPERAVLKLSIPFSAQEGPCTLYSVVYWGIEGVMGTDETEESPVGTREVLQTKSAATFSISNASKVPVSVAVVFLGEGEMDYMQMMMKMSEAMTPGFGKKSEKTLLQLSSDTVKCVQGQKTIFSEPTSAVKETGEMSMQGEATMGIFRIVFNDGKIYNFMKAQGGSSGDPENAYQFVKKKLGK